MKIKKGDNVIIISGKDKGKTGKVAKALPKHGLIVIEGINMRKKAQRPKKAGGKGQIIDRAMPIDVSNAMLVDSKTGKKTRVGYKRENGKRIRFSKKSKAVI